MEPVDHVAVDPAEPDSPSPDWRPRLVVGAVAVVAVAAVAVVVVRWWKGGGARRAVKDLAEESAVALVDVIVDELLPAA